VIPPGCSAWLPCNSLLRVQYEEEQLLASTAAVALGPERWKEMGRKKYTHTNEWGGIPDTLFLYVGQLRARYAPTLLLEPVAPTSPDGASHRPPSPLRSSPHQRLRLSPLSSFSSPSNHIGELV
jgi:hypothetical protein